MPATPTGIKKPSNAQQDAAAPRAGGGTQSESPVQAVGGDESRRPGEKELQRILKLRVPVAVSLAERDMSVAAILAMTVGTIIEFEVSFDAELALQVGHRTIAHGQAVKVGEKFGLRLSQINSVPDRIDAMGAAGPSLRMSD